MNQTNNRKDITLIEHPNGSKCLKVGDRPIVHISSVKNKKVMIYVETGEELEISRPQRASHSETILRHEEIKNQEEFLELVEVFRVLKRWRDEKAYLTE